MASEDPTVLAFWRAYLASRPQQEPPPPFEAWSFGNTPGMADHLGALVRDGVKTATAGLACGYDESGTARPQIGDHGIVLDGRGRPMCIVLTTHVDVRPFHAVDAEHAYLEGEGDRSLDYWRRTHWEYFARECRELGREPLETMPIVCERFRLVHPIRRSG